MTAEHEGPAAKVALAPLPPWSPQALNDAQAKLSRTRWGTPRYEADEVDALLAHYAKALTLARQEAENVRVAADGYARQLREGPAVGLPSRDQLAEMDSHQARMEEYQEDVEAYCAELINDAQAEADEIRRAAISGPLVEPAPSGDVASDAEAVAEWADRVEDYAQGRRRQAEEAVDLEWTRLGAVRTRLTRSRMETDRRAVIRGTAVVRQMNTREETTSNDGPEEEAPAGAPALGKGEGGGRPGLRQSPGQRGAGGDHPPSDGLGTAPEGGAPEEQGRQGLAPG